MLPHDPHYTIHMPTVYTYIYFLVIYIYKYDIILWLKLVEIVEYGYISVMRI